MQSGHRSASVRHGQKAVQRQNMWHLASVQRLAAIQFAKQIRLIQLQDRSTSASNSIGEEQHTKCVLP